MAGGIGGLIGGIGGAVSDMYTSEADSIEAAGDWTAAQSDTAAANIENQNINLEKLSTQFQDVQTQRKISQTEGAATAIEGSGNVGGGSAGDIMRESVQQGALAKTIINTQGAMQENAFQAQEDAYTGEATALKAKSNAEDKMAQGAQVAGVFSILGGIAGMLGG